jgi:hypothetical protein
MSVETERVMLHYYEILAVYSNQWNHGVYLTFNELVLTA